MRWAGHVKRLGEKIHAYGFLAGTLEGKRPFEVVVVEWRKISKYRMDYSGLVQG
jgi:hypothetical protein